MLHVWWDVINSVCLSSAACICKCTDDFSDDYDYNVNDIYVFFQRKYYLTLIDKFLSDAFESLDSIEGILVLMSFFCV